MKTSRENAKVRGRGGGAPWGTALKSRLCSLQSTHTKHRRPRRDWSAEEPMPEQVQCQRTTAHGDAVSEHRRRARRSSGEELPPVCQEPAHFVAPVASLTGPNATCSTNRDAGEKSGIMLGLGKWEERCSKLCHLVSQYTNQ